MKKKGREVMVFDEKEVARRIHVIRGRRVMLDSDLAKIYEVATKNLNKAVYRNLERFPEDFMFRLESKEVPASRFQIGTLKRGHNIKYLPYAFTFKGISMLSSVLGSKTAIQRNIYIMRVFDRVQEIKAEASSLQDKLKLIEHQVAGDKQRIDVAFDALYFLLDNHGRKKGGG